MAEAEQDGVSGGAEPPRYRGALHPDTWEQVRRRGRARGPGGPSSRRCACVRLSARRSWRPSPCS